MAQKPSWSVEMRLKFDKLMFIMIFLTLTPCGLSIDIIECPQLCSDIEV